MVVRCVSIVFALALVLAAPIQAAERDGASVPETGHAVDPSHVVEVVVNAMPLAPYDQARPIHIRVLDDSPENLEIRDSLEQALITQGVPLAESADGDSVLLLDMETAVTHAVARPDPSRSPLSLSGEAGTASDDDSVDVTVRLFSNVQGSVIGGDRDAPAPSLGGPSFRLDLGLTDPQGGRRLWQGWATVSAPALGIAGQGLLVTAPLTEALGKSVIKQVKRIVLDRPARP